MFLYPEIVAMFITYTKLNINFSIIPNQKNVKIGTNVLNEKKQSLIYLSLNLT